MAKAPRATKNADDDTLPGDDIPFDDIDTPDTDAEPAPLPSLIRLTRPHGFIDEEGRHRHWQPGTVSDPSDVAALVARGAPHEVLEH